MSAAHSTYVSRVVDHAPSEAFLEAVTPILRLVSDAGLSYRPFELASDGAPLPRRVRVYLWSMTTHEAERQPGAYKIQLTGLARRNQRGHFNLSDEAFVVVAGFNADLGVFALWDPALHEREEGIPYSQNLQVLDGTLYRAMANGIAEQSRTLRGLGAGSSETVVVASAEFLVGGLVVRWHRTLERLTGVKP